MTPISLSTGALTATILFLLYCDLIVIDFFFPVNFSYFLLNLLLFPCCVHSVLLPCIASLTMFVYKCTDRSWEGFRVMGIDWQLVCCFMYGGVHLVNSSKDLPLLPVAMLVNADYDRK